MQTTGKLKSIRYNNYTGYLFMVRFRDIRFGVAC